MLFLLPCCSVNICWVTRLYSLERLSEKPVASNHMLLLWWRHTGKVMFISGQTLCRGGMYTKEKVQRSLSCSTTSISCWCQEVTLLDCAASSSLSVQGILMVRVCLRSSDWSKGQLQHQQTLHKNSESASKFWYSRKKSVTKMNLHTRRKDGKGCSRMKLWPMVPGGYPHFSCVLRMYGMRK